MAIWETLASASTWRLFTEEKNADDVYVRSTNVKRTVESARAVVGGLTNQPSEIKIEIEGKLDEEFLTYQHSCSGSLQNYRWMWFASPLFDQIRPMWSDVIRELGLKKRTDGRQQHHLLPLSLYDDLAARFAHGIPISNASTFRKYYPLIEHLSLVTCLGVNGTSVEEKAHALPIKAGRILEYVVNELDAPVSILSAHDTTLIPVMEALLFRMAPHEKSEVFSFPPFSSHIEFEFYENATKDKFIRIKFNEKPISFKGVEYVPIEEFLKTTEWLRMSQEEFLTWKDHPIPDHDPRYSHDEIADFHANPEKYLDF